MSESPPGRSCSRCGEPVPDGAAFCPACGVRLGPAPPGRGSGLGRLAWIFRSRMVGLVESLAVRSDAQQQVTRLRYRVEECRRRRRELFERLGEAVYHGDAQGTEDARGRLRALNEEIEAKEREIATVTADAARRLSEARARTAPTVAVTPPVPPSEPSPEPLTPPPPPTVPEPSPVPSEPPAPPHVPEPSPVPHEPPIPGEPDTPSRPL